MLWSRTLGWRTAFTSDIGEGGHHKPLLVSRNTESTRFADDPRALSALSGILTRITPPMAPSGCGERARNCVRSGWSDFLLAIFSSVFV
jgi:hypothetical protein